MHAVGADGQRHVDPIVDEEERPPARGCGPKALGEREEGTSAEVLLAELHGREPRLERRLDDRHEVATAGPRPVGHEDESGDGTHRA